MADDELLKSQKNDIFTAVVDAGFAPTDFRWVKQLSTWTGAPALVLIHVPSGYKFEFHIVGGAHAAQYTPGADRPSDSSSGRTWQQIVSLIGWWLGLVERELEQPDMWAELANQSELAAAPDLATIENTPFTPSEQKRIAAQLNEVKQYAENNHGLTAPQLAALESKLDYLVEASARMGRIDWRSALVGVFLEAVVLAVLPPEAVRGLLGFALRGLSSLFGGAELLEASRRPADGGLSRAPAKVIQERVGHHSAAFTLDNYGGTFPAQHREAAERFAALVSAPR